MTELEEVEQRARSGDPAAHLEIAQYCAAPDLGEPIWWASWMASLEAARGGLAEAVHTAANAAWELMLESAETGVDIELRRQWCVECHALAVHLGGDPNPERWTLTKRRADAIKRLLDISEQNLAEARQRMLTSLGWPEWITETGERAN